MATAVSSTTTNLARSLRRYAHDGDLRGDLSNSERSSPLSSPEATPTAFGKRKRDNKVLGGPDPDATTIRRSARNTKTEEAVPQLKPRRQQTKRIESEDGTARIEAPANWEEVYNATREMRKRTIAPVDTMGCESLAEKNKSARDQRLQTLVALMLSSQTKDIVTAAAMRNLQENLPGGLNLESILHVRSEDLNRLIQKIGFHNNKTKFIKNVAVILRDRFNGDIPDTIEGLVSLPGVGPKIAYLTMSAAWGRDEGIGVDVHVHRITNLWGWHKTSTPEQTRAAMEAWLPRDRWHDINHLLVGFGQTICLPVGRKCDECDLSARSLCPSAMVGRRRKKRIRITEVEIKRENGVAVKEENVEDGVAVKKENVDADDLAASVQVKREDMGEADVPFQIPDLEGVGAGLMRALQTSGNGHVIVRRASAKQQVRSIQA